MFQTVCKVSVRSGGFPDNRDIFGSGRFLDSQEGFQTVWKVSHHGCHGLHGMYAKAIYALLGTFMSQNYLHAFGAFLSRTWFTRSVRKVFARDILPTGKFWLFVSLECRHTRKLLLRAICKQSRDKQTKQKSFPVLTTDVTTSTRWEAQETFYQGNQQLSPTAS